MISIKSGDQIAKMSRAGEVVATALRLASDAATPGTTTAELDAIVEDSIRTANCRPSFKGYQGFPASCCVSINNQVVHGIPGSRVVEAGDLVKIDVGAIYDGWHADSATTVYVGHDMPEAIEKLLRVTQDALLAGMSQATDGARLSDISHAIQQVAEGAGFSVVRDFVGHGLGTELHEEPQIPNYGDPGKGPVLKSGMTIAIEPMVNLGDWATKVDGDKWTVVTADGSLSAHFEHSVAITDDEPLVLTMERS